MIITQPFLPDRCASEEDRRTNAKRVADALAALDMFTMLDEDPDNPVTEQDREGILPALLCDLRHLCHQRGWDFKAMLRESKAHFDTESGLDGTEDEFPIRTVTTS